MPIRPTAAAGTKAAVDPAGQRVLVCSAARPPGDTERGIDIRPGTVATFDGDRVRLQLTVSGPDQRVRVSWLDLPGLDDAVSSLLEAKSPRIVRFGDRAVCRRLLGRVRADIVERRLASTARATGATLVTWTDVPRSEVDTRPYEMVVDRASPIG